MSDYEVEKTELSDEQIDKLVDSSEKSSNRDVPMTAKEAEPKEPQVKEETIYEFNHNGKPIKATRDELVKWAQQGYDYPQKMQLLNQTKAQMEKHFQEWESKWTPYKQIDEWAAKNPDQWKALEQSWRSGQYNPAATQSNQNDPYAPKFQSLEQKLAQIEQFTQTQMAKEQTENQKRLDEKLDQDVKSIREQYKDLDWSNLDETGKTLEQKVLEHASQNGIANFKTAFRDFYHDQLIERAGAQAKLNISKGIQSQTKLGVLGTSPTSQKRGLTETKDPRKQSYEELAKEGLAELLASA